MSFTKFTKIFGKSKKQIDHVATIAKLSQTLADLEKKEKLLLKKASAEVEKAKAYTKAKNKRAAIQCLKKKKLYEQQIGNLANAQLRIHDQVTLFL
ncbi:snf7 family [Artemisia annua]|uniref:Snf7 family n=1 Tax=Artemisia annua TaxID=35608 RepID=A0A2U1N5Y9_ARTAN|nr:snf7 family [Artemisia annua]